MLPDDDLAKVFSLFAIACAVIAIAEFMTPPFVHLFDLISMYEEL